MTSRTRDGGVAGMGVNLGKEPTAAEPCGAAGGVPRTAACCPRRPQRWSAQPAESRVPPAGGSAAQENGRERGQGGDGRGRGGTSGSGMRTQVLWGHAGRDKAGDTESVESRLAAARGIRVAHVPPGPQAQTAAPVHPRRSNTV